MEIIDIEQPAGVIVQYGGQTPLKLARRLEAAGAPIVGTSPDSIDLAEDRDRFQQLVERLELRQPANRTARSEAEALRLAAHVGYPMVVRPSYVLGGRAMEIVYEDVELERYMRTAVKVSNDAPVLLDRFLEDAVEVDVDAISDGESVVVAGLLEHIEQAGVHSGDSACSLPPYSLSDAVRAEICRQVQALARALRVVGLVNAQFAVKDEMVYLIEVNPRASRTVPFVSKATGHPLAKIAARCMLGQTLDEQGIQHIDAPEYYSVKESVFPFAKFPGVDPILGPEMKSTGEVMGIGRTFAEAFAKSLTGAGMDIPREGTVFISVRDGDKPQSVEMARKLIEHGMRVVATRGTANYLREQGVECTPVNKVKEGRPHCVDMIVNGEIQFVVNTTEGRKAIEESHSIRSAAVTQKVAYFTTLAAARAAAMALEYRDQVTVNRVQDLHANGLRIPD